jgi:hypothetical protein
MCFTDDRRTGLGDLAERVRALEQTGDLAEFGRFHYVIVKRTPKGTHVRTIWNEGPLPVAKMFPSTGDAVGFDSDIVPRPPNARRTLSATSTEVPFSVHAYESTDGLPAVRDFYDREMVARGWGRHDFGTTIVYEKPGADFVYCTFSVKDGRTSVIATATGRDGTPTVAVVRAEP